MMYDVKFICRDNEQCVGGYETDYSDYINPFGDDEYTEADNAADALTTVLEELCDYYMDCGYEVALSHGNYLLLINDYGQYLEFQRGIAYVVSAQ